MQRLTVVSAGVYLYL